MEYVLLSAIVVVIPATLSVMAHALSAGPFLPLARRRQKLTE